MHNTRGPGMTMAALFLQEGLRRALIELVRSKGDTGLAWLTDFQNELVRDAKSASGVDGLPIEDEAEIMSIALNYLDFVFDGIRREITEEPDESG
jgi:hypothetical protein